MEPSSATIISRSASLWLVTERRQSARYGLQLKTGIITDTLGAMFDVYFWSRYGSPANARGLADLPEFYTSRPSLSKH